MAHAGEQSVPRRRRHHYDSIPVVGGSDMADRFFPNEMPRFVAETTAEETETASQTPTTEDSLTTLLSLPYQTLSSKFQASAFHLKQSVVRETWGSSGNRVKDYTLYTGALGTAYMVFKAYQVTKNVNDLNLCSEIVKACDSASVNSGCSFSFMHQRLS